MEVCIRVSPQGVPLIRASKEAMHSESSPTSPMHARRRFRGCHQHQPRAEVEREAQM